MKNEAAFAAMKDEAANRRSVLHGRASGIIGGVAASSARERRHRASVQWAQ